MKMAAGCAKNLADRRILARHLSVTSPVQLMEIAYAMYGDDSPALNDSASRTNGSLTMCSPNAVDDDQKRSGNHVLARFGAYSSVAAGELVGMRSAEYRGLQHLTGSDRSAEIHFSCS